MNFMPTPSKVRKAIRNEITCTAIISFHLILFFLSDLHRLTQIPIIKISLNMIEQSFIMRACLLWPKFYYYLFKQNNNRRTIWEINTCLVPRDVRKAREQSNRIPCLKATFSCFLSYQVQGSYAHLNQRHETACKISYYNDPLCLADPYVYLLEILPEPPNGLLKLIFSITPILIVYLYPILRCLIRLWGRSLLAYMSHRKCPTLHIYIYATAADPNEKNFLLGYGGGTVCSR